MNINKSKQARGGWTLAEMLLIIAAIVFLMAISVSWMAMQRRKPVQIDQVNNSRRIKFPFRTWWVDEADQRVMSNDPGGTKLVVCPTNGAKTVAESFRPGKSDRGTVSYFIGSNSYPQIIVVGGRNAMSNGVEGNETNR